MKNNFRFDKFIKGSAGKQLSISIIASILIILVLWGLGSFYENKFGLIDIIGMFIDPGNLGVDENAGQVIFRLVVTLIGVIMFSALTVSIITNAFDQTNENINHGNRRYYLRNHVLILGSGDQLDELIRLHHGERVVVVSLQQPKNEYRNVIYYHADRTDCSALSQCCADRASKIYIIGDDNENGHDAKNIQCLDYLRQITDKSKEKKRIDCYVTMDKYSSTEIYQITRQNCGQSGRLLLVDVINEKEYRAEQFLAESDFLPVIREDDQRCAHVIVVGEGEAAQAVAYTVAHACHYPDLNGNARHTLITVMSDDAVAFRDRLVSSRPYLFHESDYKTLYKDGSEEGHSTQNGLLDIEWEFVEGSPLSVLGRTLVEKWISDENFATRIVVCGDDSDKNAETVLHLHEDVFDKYNTPVAVYLENDVNVVNKAKTAARYDNISIFGPFNSDKPVGLTTRSSRGRRVNYIYQKAYKKPEGLKSIDDEWYELEECDKYSSIYCSLALPLRRACFSGSDRMAIYEAEHRRWMMSQFLMGFRYGDKKDKALLTHPDLVPFSTLSDEEKLKDKILIDNMDYVLGDREEVVIK